MFGPLDDLMSFLHPLLGAIGHGAEVTRLGAEVRSRSAAMAAMWQDLSPEIHGAEIWLPATVGCMHGKKIEEGDLPSGGKMMAATTF